jgi:preprotein translocase subunit SecA
MPLDLFEEFPGLRELLSRGQSYAVMRSWREDVADFAAVPGVTMADAGADHPKAVALAGGSVVPAAPSATPEPRVVEAPRNLGDVSGPSKIGRNDPCPCGSGQKYKQCHGRLA